MHLFHTGNKVYSYLSPLSHALISTPNNLYSTIFSSLPVAHYFYLVYIHDYLIIDYFSQHTSKLFQSRFSLIFPATFVTHKLTCIHSSLILFNLVTPLRIHSSNLISTTFVFTSSFLFLSFIISYHSDHCWPRHYNNLFRL